MTVVGRARCLSRLSAGTLRGHYTGHYWTVVSTGQSGHTRTTSSTETPHLFSFFLSPISVLHRNVDYF